MNDKSATDKSNQSASTSVTLPGPTLRSDSEKESELGSTAAKPSAEQKSESRMKHKPHPAENVEDSNTTM